MRKGYTIFETLISLALIAILVTVMFEAGSAATDKALEIRVQHSTLLLKAKEEAYKLIQNNDIEDQTYEIEDQYTVNVETCSNGFILELYPSDLEFTETDDCEEQIEIATFNACTNFKSQIKKVCKV